LAKRLKASQYRLLSVVAIDRGKEREPSDEPLPLDQFRATFYDYTNEMAIVCEGRLDKPREYDFRERRYQALPTNAEFDAAVAQLRKSADFRRVLKDDLLIPYRPMPPLIAQERADGVVPRVVAVGLMPRASTPRGPSRSVRAMKSSVCKWAVVKSRVSPMPPHGAPARKRSDVAPRRGRDSKPLVVRRNRASPDSHQGVPPCRARGAHGLGAKIRVSVSSHEVC
jgi:hypothetical protein